MNYPKLALFVSTLFFLSCSSEEVAEILIQAQTTNYTNLGAVPSFSQSFESNDPDNGPTGFSFDVDATGILSGGLNDLLESAFSAAAQFEFLAGNEFDGDVFFPTRTANNTDEAYLEDVDGDGTADQIILQATADNGLVVTRKIYVAPSYECGDDAQACGWIRYLECISNPTDSTLSATPRIESRLDGNGATLLGTADGTDGLDAPFYLALTDATQARPNIAVVLGFDASGEDDPGTNDPDPNDVDVVDFGWGLQNFDPDETGCFMYYFILGNAEDEDDELEASDILELSRTFYNDSPRTGIRIEEDVIIRNFPDGLVNVTGSAGAVEDGATVEITNSDSNESITVTAASNGSFEALLACDRNDTITISSGDVNEEVNCD